MKAEYIDHMGDDLSVVRAARVSFAKDEKWNKTCTVYMDGSSPQVLKPEDHKLISYLARHSHWTPFAHTSITFRVSAPIPIRTQCFKHKQGFVENEESRRYISSKPELYVPDEFRKAPEGSIKQGSGGIHLSSERWRQYYIDRGNLMIEMYEAMIADGVCPEQARLILPQGCIVNWYWTGSLAAYSRFYKQRTDPHAQKEIQQLAEMIGEKLAELYPVSWKALTI